MVRGGYHHSDERTPGYPRNRLGQAGMSMFGGQRVADGSGGGGGDVPMPGSAVYPWPGSGYGQQQLQQQQDTSTPYSAPQGGGYVPPARTYPEPNPDPSVRVGRKRVDVDLSNQSSSVLDIGSRLDRQKVQLNKRQNDYRKALEDQIREKEERKKMEKMVNAQEDERVRHQQQQMMMGAGAGSNAPPRQQPSAMSDGYFTQPSQMPDYGQEVSGGQPYAPVAATFDNPAQYQQQWQQYPPQPYMELPPINRQLPYGPTASPQRQLGPYGPQAAPYPSPPRATMQPPAAAADYQQYPGPEQTPYGAPTYGYSYPPQQQSYGYRPPATLSMMHPGGENRVSPTAGAGGSTWGPAAPSPSHFGGVVGMPQPQMQQLTPSKGSMGNGFDPSGGSQGSNRQDLGKQLLAQMEDKKRREKEEKQRREAEEMADIMRIQREEYESNLKKEREMAAERLKKAEEERLSLEMQIAEKKRREEDQRKRERELEREEEERLKQTSFPQTRAQLPSPIIPSAAREKQSPLRTIGRMVPQPAASPPIHASKRPQQLKQSQQWTEDPVSDKVDPNASGQGAYRLQREADVRQDRRGGHEGFQAHSPAKPETYAQRGSQLKEEAIQMIVKDELTRTLHSEREFLREQLKQQERLIEGLRKSAEDAAKEHQGTQQELQKLRHDILSRPKPMIETSEVPGSSSPPHAAASSAATAPANRYGLDISAAGYPAHRPMPTAIVHHEDYPRVGGATSPAKLLSSSPEYGQVSPLRPIPRDPRWNGRWDRLDALSSESRLVFPSDLMGSLASVPPAANPTRSGPQAKDRDGMSSPRHMNIRALSQRDLVHATSSDIPSERNDIISESTSLVPLGKSPSRPVIRSPRKEAAVISPSKVAQPLQLQSVLGEVIDIDGLHYCNQERLRVLEQVEHAPEFRMEELDMLMRTFNLQQSDRPRSGHNEPDLIADSTWLPSM